MSVNHLALALLIACLLSASASAQAAIEFPRGAGTEVREGAINKGVTAWDYQLRVKPGQTVVIKLEPSPARGAVFALSYEGEGDHPIVLTSNAVSWSGRLPNTEVEDRQGIATYNISVIPRARRPRGEVKFRLTITLR